MEKKNKLVLAGDYWSVNDSFGRGHPSIITKRKKGKVEHISITHSPSTRRKRNIKLRKNPKKGDKDDSYIVPKVAVARIADLGKKHQDMSIKDPVDKSIIRKMKHSRNKNK